MCDGRQWLMNLGSTCRGLECDSYGDVRNADGISLHWNKMVFFLISGLVVESCPVRLGVFVACLFSNLHVWFNTIKIACLREL